MNRIRFVTISLFLIIILLWLIQFLIKDHLDSPTTFELQKIEERIEYLKHENLLLEEKILEASSLHIIEAEARKRGMIEGYIISLH